MRETERDIKVVSVHQDGERATPLKSSRARLRERKNKDIEAHKRKGEKAYHVPLLILFRRTTMRTECSGESTQ